MTDIHDPSPVRPALTIGVINGGATPKNQDWDVFLDELMDRNQVIIDAGLNSEADLNLNIEFQVPGAFLRPDFEGARSGYFRREDRLLKVQVALPEGPPSDPWVLLATAMGNAVEVADAWAHRRRVRCDLGVQRQLVELLVRSPRIAP
jgi:hypothetical protein